MRRDRRKWPRSVLRFSAAARHDLIMARLARIVVRDVAHHITQRGNARRQVFFSDADRNVYLQLLSREAANHQLTILGYCLMTNHVHIVAIPRDADSMALTFRYTHGQYATYLNALQHRTGHVWQGRYYSCALDEPHMWRALRYIELNPVAAGVVARASAWPWSSAALHCGLSALTSVVDVALWSTRWTPERWRVFLSTGTPKREADAISKNTHAGRPLGSRTFVRNIESTLNRSLLPRRRIPHFVDTQCCLWPD